MINSLFGSLGESNKQYFRIMGRHFSQTSLTCISDLLGFGSHKPFLLLIVLVL
ncbi:hypothetical protein VCRA2116O29_280025 [Vibrio crassostreae]|nr:hypothetical protein VCRA2110O182_10327 [Vibrio crassostreae]CAK1876239.1 hypothetical protein VCRA2118O429_10469 [Vibrio crassostreae]CAK1985479.1 hypothetical protein VCRA2118O144_20137 [Vibrio crassostreae]CAK2008917.1 hypothetical protein VCRA2113O414_20272 [Vibrio crassostreae]CAK2092253.1 hypothetical protein VCRA2116O233_30101 [Vibrio crassostreae]